LMRLFRRHVGMPMHALQTQLRVELGKRLLQRGMTASQTALEVGFADQSHFTKRFKEMVGTSPVAYQRNRQPERREK
jgi:AraC-like DNA-binding protein